MFFDPAEFEFTAHLEANWRTIREEFEQLGHEAFRPWPEPNLCPKGWDVFGLFIFQERIEAHCALCPQTTRILQQVEGLTTAGFSVLNPKTKIRPHRGYTGTVLRGHLGLIVPEGCGIQVGNKSKSWREGKVLVFDDTNRHRAWNDSDRARAVLLFDFLRPETPFETPEHEFFDTLKTHFGVVTSK